MPIQQQKRFLFGLMLLVLYAVLLGGCEENPEAVSLDDLEAGIFSDTLYAIADNSFPYQRSNFTTIGSNRLLIGKLNNYEAHTILRFGAFPDSVDIQSAELIFKRAGALKTGSATPFEVTAYPITQSWLADSSEIWRNNDPLDNVKIDAPMGSMTANDQDNRFTFTFGDSGIAWLNHWVVDQEDETLDTNYGMLFTFDNANFMLEVYSRNIVTAGDSLQPALHISYRHPDSVNVQQDTLYVITDAFLARGGFSPQADRIYTSTFSDGFVSLLSFNIDSLSERYRELYPSGVIVSSANLQLFIDTDSSYFRMAPLEFLPIVSPIDSSGFRLETRFQDVFGIEIEMQVLNADSSRLEVGDVSLGNISGERREFVSNYIQVHFNEAGVFSGYVLKDAAFASNLRRFVFYRHDDPDPARRPRLIIRSLRLPGERL